jgi:fructose-1-phosphate kinase PfkB-like protein
MIFTVTLNPSLDRTLSIPDLHPVAPDHGFAHFSTSHI